MHRRNFLLGLGAAAVTSAIGPITPPIAIAWQSALNANIFGNFPMMVRWHDAGEWRDWTAPDLSSATEGGIIGVTDD